MAIQSSSGGDILRCREITHRPFREDPKAPGVTEERYRASWPREPRSVFVVLVLGRLPEKEEETNADLVRVMDELGWTPKPGHTILDAVASEQEGR